MADHDQRAIQRALAVTSPLAHGPDVAALQKAIKAWRDSVKLSVALQIDGEYGPDTELKAVRTLGLLGADPAGDDKPGKVLSQEEQKLIRNPDSRNAEQKDRSKHRVKDAQDAQSRQNTGAGAAVAEAHRLIGTVESPLGSNRGPVVDEMTRFAGLVPPVFWCGCFAAWCAVHAGKAKVNPINLVNNVTLVNLARAGGYGLTPVAIGHELPGDIVSYTFAHIGLIVGPTVNGRLHTIEGNTSQYGHVSNGGGVYEHTDRSYGLVLGIVRPDYS